MIKDIDQTDLHISSSRIISWAHWMALFTLGGLDKLIAQLNSLVFTTLHLLALYRHRLASWGHHLVYKRLDVY